MQGEGRQGDPYAALGADLVVSGALFMDGAAGHARMDLDGVHVDVLLCDEDAVSVFECGRQQSIDGVTDFLVPAVYVILSRYLNG